MKCRLDGCHRGAGLTASLLSVCLSRLEEADKWTTGVRLADGVPSRRQPAIARVGARRLLLVLAEDSGAWGRQVRGQPARARGCWVSRSSSFHAAARTRTIAATPAGTFPNIALPLAISFLSSASDS